MSATIEIEQQGKIATLLLIPDKPHRPPTFDSDSLQSFATKLQELEAAIEREEVALVFLRSASERFFCAGANLQVLQTMDQDSIEEWVTRGHSVFAQLEDLPVPTIARVEGGAYGGGLELALACDLIFASDAARFGQTEATLGVVTGWAASMRLPQRVGVFRAKHFLYSGRIYSATEAEGFGLVDFVGDAESLEAECQGFAKDSLANSSLAHREHKRMLSVQHMASRVCCLKEEIKASKSCINSIDTKNRLRDFFAKRS